MALISNYLGNALLNWLRGTAMPTAPAALYIGLFTSDPTAANTGGAEVTSTIRTAGRVTPTFGSASSAKSIAITAIADFGNAAGAVGSPVTHYAIFDAATGGNKLVSDALSAPLTVGAGTPVNFPVGQLTLTA